MHSICWIGESSDRQAHAHSRPHLLLPLRIRCRHTSSGRHGPLLPPNRHVGIISFYFHFSLLFFFSSLTFCYPCITDKTIQTRAFLSSQPSSRLPVCSRRFAIQTKMLCPPVSLLRAGILRKVQVCTISRWEEACSASHGLSEDPARRMCMVTVMRRIRRAGVETRLWNLSRTVRSLFFPKIGRAHV